MKSWKTLVLAGSQYLALATQLITGPLIARELGPQDRGILATILVIYALLPIVAGFGTHAHFRALVAHGVSCKDAYSWLVRRTLLSLGISAALSLITFWIFEPAVDWESWIVFLLLGTSAMATYRNSILSASVLLDRLDTVSRNSIINGALTLSGISLLFVLDTLTLGSACAVYLLANVVSTAVLAKPLVWEDTGGVFSKGLRYSLTAVPGQVGEVGLSRIDQLLVAVILGPATAGYYAVAFSYAYMLYPLLHTVSLKAVGGLKSRQANPWKNGKSFLILAAVTAAGVVILDLMSEWVITLLFGPLFESSVEIARILLISVGLMGLSIFFIQMNASRARARDNSIAAIVGMLTIIVAGSFLAPWGGAIGMAWATVGGVAVNLALLCALSRGGNGAKHRK